MRSHPPPYPSGGPRVLKPGGGCGWRRARGGSGRRARQRRCSGDGCRHRHHRAARHRASVRAALRLGSRSVSRSARGVACSPARHGVSAHDRRQRRRSGVQSPVRALRHRTVPATSTAVLDGDSPRPERLRRRGAVAAVRADDRRRRSRDARHSGEDLLGLGRPTKERVSGRPQAARAASPSCDLVVISHGERMQARWTSDRRSRVAAQCFGDSSSIRVVDQ